MGCDSDAYLIIGAGVAGLCAAMRLLDHGVQPLLLDAGDFPAHKICGEFFSPECLPLLQKWGLAPEISVNQVRYFVKEGSYTFTLPATAGSESRYSFDAKLLTAIEKRGARVRLKTRVATIEEGRVVLSSGEEIRPENLFLGIGRRGLTKQKVSYYGIKAHLEGLQEEGLLQMRVFPGAYLGISPVEGGRANVACLASKEVFEKEESVAALMKKLLPQLDRPVNWLKAELPGFGLSSCPNWKDTYFIGDAGGRVTPSSGDGLAAAVFSGVSAADYAMKGDWKGYRKYWIGEWRRRVWWDAAFHRIMMTPWLASPFFQCLKTIPPAFPFLFEKTRTRYGI